ncbi:MAG: SRPBCC family protein [Ferruginibacter sp.]|nr:SRPBCC family protein [Ferruginibacter sp.]
MDKKVIAKKILINTTAENVWRVFTEPEITRQMGGEYLTDWKVGSSFSWKGTDGNIYTHGAILQLIPNEILKHSLFSPDDPKHILSAITYRLEETDGITTLFAREERTYDMTDEEYEGAGGGWEYALNLLREKAENLPAKS